MRWLCHTLTLLAVLAHAPAAHGQDLPPAPSSDARPPDLDLREAEHAFARGHCVRARSLYARAAAAGLWSAASWASLGECDLRMHDPASAAEHFERAIAIAPHVAHYRASLGLALVLDGDTGPGRASLRDALALDAHEPIAADALALLDHGGVDALDLFGTTTHLARAWLLGELQGIDERARSVTTLYAISIPGAIAGGVIGGSLYALASDGSARSPANVRQLTDGSVIAFLIGAVALGVLAAAIGLDAATHARRERWHARLHALEADGV